MNRFFRVSTFVALAGLMLAAVPSTQAAFMTGTQGLADIGTPTIAGGSTLSTATVFNFSDLFTTTAETGSFASTPSAKIDLGAASLNLNAPQLFTFGNTAFGTFAATSIQTTFSSDQTRSFYIVGTFTPGTNFAGGSMNTASFNVSFTANSTSSGISYSDSGTLSVPASPLGAVVPEPASVVMLGLGLTGVAGFTARRRRQGK